MINSHNRPRPVMMTPLRRCGSHALRLRLNPNKDFYAPYPLHVVDFLPLLPLYGNLNNDNSYFQLITDLVGLQNALMVKWPDLSLDPVDIFERIKNQTRSIHRVVWEMLFIAGEKHDARIVMDKSLDSIHNADELMKLFPDMLFLNVVRDPRAQIASMNKAIIYEFDTLLNTQVWVKAFDKARQLADQYPDRVLTIRFEDFISSEAEVINKICQFFDIEFEEGMLDIEHSNEAASITTRSALWESNSSTPIAANVDKFKSMLSDKEIETIESLTSDHMDYYGYEKMTPANIQISDSMQTMAENNSRVGRAKAWKDLAVNNPRDYMLRKFRADYLQMIRHRFEMDQQLQAI